MILQYTVENFYSFRETAVVDFTVPAQAGNRPGLLTSKSGQRVNAVTAILGANASGKTNLLKPLAFLQWFLVNSAQSEPGEEILCEPFEFTTNMEGPIRIRVHFEHRGEEYNYQVTVTMQRVLEESLQRKKQRFAYLFERFWNQDTGEYDFKAQEIGPSANVPQRENASWLSSALLLKHPFAVDILGIFKTFQGNLPLEIQPLLQDQNQHDLFKATEFFHQAPDMLDQASRLISQFDLGLGGFQNRKMRTMDADGKAQDLYITLADHRVAGQSFLFPLTEESRGTQSLFVLLRHLLPVLDSGGCAFIDDADSGLHPHMVKAVVDLFFNPATNPKNAQLIATFHTDYLLRDTLNKYQTYLVEKDDTLNSYAYRLDSIRQAKGGKAPRNVENLYEKYHTGAYGGVPNLM